MSDLDRVMGRSEVLETTTTGSVPPVMTGPGQGDQSRRRGKRTPEEEAKRRHRATSSVLSVIGEAADEEEYEETTEQRDGVIPKDAEEVDDGRIDPSGLNLKTPKFKKANPDSPRGEREALMTPKAALVAPDVTPNSMTELDPSEVPGGHGETFTAQDAAVPPPPGEPVPPAAPSPSQDRFTSTMDTLLGRQRTPGASAPQPAVESVRAPISAETAAAMFTPPVEGVSGDALLRQNQPMPEPTVGDGRKVFESFRRFI